MTATLLKVTLLQGCFSRFLNYMNVTKSRNEPPIDFPFPLQFLVPTDKNSQLVFTIPYPNQI